MRKSTLILVLVSVFGFAAIISTSCKKEDPVTQTEFVIQVDSIIHPDTISVGDVLSIKFYGVIGPNSCFQFSHWANDFNVGLIQITTYGIEHLDQNCTQGSVSLNGAEYRLSGVPAGDYTIKIVQPNDSTMNSPLHVK